MKSGSTKDRAEKESDLIFRDPGSGATISRKNQKKRSAWWDLLARAGPSMFGVSSYHIGRGRLGGLHPTLCFHKTSMPSLERRGTLRAGIVSVDILKKAEEERRVLERGREGGKGGKGEKAKNLNLRRLLYERKRKNVGAIEPGGN